MGGVKISDYAIDTTKWTELLSTLEKQRKGKIALSLTNYENTSLPAIEAGSNVEIGGALYGFVVEEAISGAAITGNINYIMIDPTPITASWTLVAPIWSPSKNGWYDAGEAKRYIGGCYFATPNYTGKWMYEENRVALGSPEWPSFHVTKAGAGAPQLNITGTQKILWPVEIFDTNNDFASDRFTPTVAGTYLLTVTMRWSGITDGDIIEMYLYKNGAQIHAHIFKTGPIYAVTTLTVIVKVNGSTDYFEIWAVNNSRDTSDIYGYTEVTYWMGSRIG